MRFGKEFKKQKVPEWTDAYMDYNGLKKDIRITLAVQAKYATSNTRESSSPEVEIS